MTIRSHGRTAQLAGYRAVFRNGRYECPVCGGRFGRFAPARAANMCPRCRSLERQRTMALYLRGRDLTGARILHLAPEPSLHALISAIPAVDYVTGDIQERPLAQLRLDARALPFGDGEFDVVMANHVLEHIPEDVDVLREFRRVLRPGGAALVQVPIDMEREETYEDFTITDPAERERAFGQFDHVRWYGRDIVARYAQAGMAVDWILVEDFTTEEERDRHRLVDRAAPIRSNDILRCTPA